MKIALQIVSFNWAGSPKNIGPRLADLARAADESGFESIWVRDHFFQMDMPQMGLKPEEPMLDGYTALSYMAAVTQFVRLGTLVTGVTYRHPGHLVKVVSNLENPSPPEVGLRMTHLWDAIKASAAQKGQPVQIEAN